VGVCKLTSDIALAVTGKVKVYVDYHCEAVEDCGMLLFNNKNGGSRYNSVKLLKETMR
jgi:hypothetical protein